MTDIAVMRTEYINVSTGTVRTGATGHGESLTDVESYLLPLDAARMATLHTWGVAGGLTVRATTGQTGVTIAPGTALDAAGHTVVLAANGTAVVDPDVDPNEIVNIPTVTVPPGGLTLATDGLSSDRFLTLTWREVLGTSAVANAPVLLHAPWLRLVPAAGFVHDGAQVALAKVGLDASGKVTGLSIEGRRLAGIPAGRLELRAPRAAGGTIDLAPAAELFARPDGGVALNVLSGGVQRPALAVDPATGTVQFPSGLQLTSVGRTFSVSAGADARLRVTDVTAGTDRLVIDAAGNVGIGLGTRAPRRPLHVEGNEIHSGGPGGGFSFADRNVSDVVNNPGNTGQRWIWYAQNGSARLWSGFDRLTITATGEGGGLDVGRRMRVRQGGDSSAGIWFLQDAPGNDRAFVGMAGDDLVGFWGNTGAGWGLRMNTSSGEVLFSGKFGQPNGPSTLSLFGSRIGDTGGGVLFLRSGGGIITFDGGNNVGINTRSPGTPLEVVGSATAIKGRGGGGIFQAGVHGIGNLGVWAEGSNNGILAVGPNFAGVFWGHVQITRDLDVRGTLFKGGGGFRIDHPLDPANKYLSHSYVESPEMLNLYAGRVATDDDGNATVVLPDYFDALNRDFSYQLTPIGQPAAVAVVDEISDNRFTIRTDTPGVEVSWQVTGVRRDPWADAHRIVVEDEKPDTDRGLFLHPEMHDEDDEKSLMGPGRARADR
jgi:hypothetical protein